MAITSSAKKAYRVSLRKRSFNMVHKKQVTSAVGEIKKLVAAKKSKEALALLSSAYKAIDKAAKTNFLHKNTASRKKARLAALINRNLKK